jgi:D-glycero-D-manno-heptose 1,7-bisphosphate phosphatase
MIKCFFFDRDGVLIKNYGYLNDISKLKWLKGAINSTKILNKKKIRVIIITNQSGIARGFFTEKELNKFHKMMNFILKKKGGIIDKLYYCPYHPNGKIQKYKRKSNLRKDQRSDYLCAKKSKVYFEYKKKYALDIQVNNVLKKFNDK